MQEEPGFKILVELSWLKNTEYDLLGYNIYRSVTNGQLGNKLNQNILPDTSYVDASAGNGIYYYYTVKAIDSLLNESLNNTTLRSRVVSLDQGILIVDETLDGDGSPMSPTDEQVDDFYNELLSNFAHDEYDLAEGGNMDLGVLGAYSSVIWHGNDTENLNAPFIHKQLLKQYLDFGGSILFTVYRPSKAFEQIFGYQGSYGPGDFIYDYLKIDESQGSAYALFNGAIGIESGYSNIYVDSAKTLASNQYHLKTIENIEPSSAGTAIFIYETMFDSTSIQGSLKGKPVGVEYIGTDYKTVTLSFPLYYMNKDQAKTLIEYILTNKFDEVMAVDEYTDYIPVTYQLEQNYPNPFNPSTRIAYSIPEDGFVKLAVYNMLGEEVAVIVNTTQKTGRYEVKFDASKLSSGVYIYRIEAANFTASKKLMLLK